MSFIHIDMPKASESYAHKTRKNIAVMFNQGCFEFHDGSITLNFDSDGLISSVEKHLKWRRDKDLKSNLPIDQQNATLKIT